MFFCQDHANFTDSYSYSRHYGFVALGISRLLPTCLQFLVRDKVERLYKYAELTVRDVQHAVLSLGYSVDDLLKSCPKAPIGNEIDPTIRRLKAVLTHPIGKISSLVCLHLLLQLLSI